MSRLILDFKVMLLMHYIEEYYICLCGYIQNISHK